MSSVAQSKICQSSEWNSLAVSKGRALLRSPVLALIRPSQNAHNARKVGLFQCRFNFTSNRDSMELFRMISNWKSGLDLGGPEPMDDTISSTF
jgi:hypothetical protein